MDSTIAPDFQVRRRIPHAVNKARPAKPANKTLSKRVREILLMREQNYPPREIAMMAIMSRSMLNMTWKVEPEQRICIAFADRMRDLSKSGKYKGIWGHIPNEGKRHPIVAVILLAMGMLPGGTDYYFMGLWGCGVIEFKASGNGLTKTQECFRDWCEADGVKHAMATSSDEGLEVLRQWGAII